MATSAKASKGIFDPRLLKGALKESFKKLDPRILWSNPVMLCVEAGSVITTVNFAYALISGKGDPAWFTGHRHLLAVVNRALCHLCRSYRGRPGPGPGRGPAQDPHRNPGQKAEKAGIGRNL